MKQSSTTNDDLQKAIDDITKSTKTDPVFSDPVAAPSSIPEGDTGELDEAIGPFPAPEPAAVPPAPENQFVETVPQEPTMSIDPSLATDPNAQNPMPPMPNPNEAPLPPLPDASTMPEPMLEPAPEPMMPSTPESMPESIAPAPEPIPEPIAPAPEPIPTIAPEPTDDAFVTPSFDLPEPATASTTSTLGVREVKEAALRDLIPLLSHLDMNPSQKFNIYRHIFEDLRDYTVLDSAYRAATEISDDKERAEALLYLVEAIDKM